MILLHSLLLALLRIHFFSLFLNLLHLLIFSDSSSPFSFFTLLHHLALRLYFMILLHSLLLALLRIHLFSLFLNLLRLLIFSDSSSPFFFLHPPAPSSSSSLFYDSSSFSASCSTPHSPFLTFSDSSSPAHFF